MTMRAGRPPREAQAVTAQPTFRAVSGVMGGWLATPRMPSVPKSLRTMEEGGARGGLAPGTPGTFGAPGTVAAFAATRGEGTGVGRDLRAAMGVGRGRIHAATGLRGP